MRDAIEQFRDALHRREIIPPDEIIADGQIHRCDVEGKNGKGDASYLLHRDGVCAGGFENWKDGFGWENWRADLGRSLTRTEEAAHRANVEAMRQAREEDEVQRKTDARKRAAAIWDQAQPATGDHPYLTAKCVRPNGIKLYKGLLVVPMRDASGVLHSLQFIPPDGKGKRFLKDGRTDGCYFGIGKPNGALCIAEGYATGASIHEATGCAVAVAFSAGNLEAVARALRKKFPEPRLILCADDDFRTEGNPGVTKATEAAQAVGGLLAIPNFGADRPEDATDFNDLHRLRGLEAVERAMRDAKSPEAPQVQPRSENAVKGDFDGKQDWLESPNSIRALDVFELAKMRFHPRDAVLHPWLRRQDLAMIYAKRGIGKTHFAMGVAFAVATGGEFLRWKAEKPHKVLYLDGELPGATMQARLAMHAPDVDPAPGMLRVFTPDLLSIDEPLPDLARVDGQEAITAMIEPDTALVIVDNLSAWARGSRAENDAESWLPIADWVLGLRRRGIAVLLIHHAGKGGDQRGTSKREDLLDVVIRLVRPDDYDPKVGARFRLEFTKARHLHGGDAEGLDVRMQTEGETGTWVWTTLENSIRDRVIQLNNEGLSGTEIATELGVNKSTVSRHLKAAKADGRIGDAGHGRAS